MRPPQLPRQSITQPRAHRFPSCRPPLYLQFSWLLSTEQELLSTGKHRKEEGVDADVFISCYLFTLHGTPNFPEALLSWGLARRSNASVSVPVNQPPVSESAWLVAGSPCHVFVLCCLLVDCMCPGSRINTIAQTYYWLPFNPLLTIPASLLSAMLAVEQPSWFPPTGCQ